MFCLYKTAGLPVLSAAVARAPLPDRAGPSRPTALPRFAVGQLLLFGSDRVVTAEAKAVVDQLVSKFTERSVKVSTTQSNLTTDFLSSELRNAKGELDRLATRWRHFARPMPGGFPSRFRTISRL